MTDRRGGRQRRGLERRAFLKLGGASAVAASVGTAACTTEGLLDGVRDRQADGDTAWWVDEAFELEEATLSQLAEAMASGARTSESITRLYLDRIEALDREGPRLRSMIETNPDALDLARGLDAERAAGDVRGPLHGVPIVVKDNIDTADGMTTTAGSLALAGHVAAVDSHVVARLREAGAVILGKANLSEWANIRSTRSSSGWSARGGQCGNAYALDRNPCGSSSGSAAAAAANFCAAAIGTETNGSIVCPASVNGLVGLKPTVGLVSRSGIIPIAHTQDTAGPMTRTVADAATVLSAIVGADSRDRMTGPAADYEGTDYTQFLDPDGLRGARIGVERSYMGVEPAVDELMRAAIDVMRELGATVVDPAPIPTRERMSEPSYLVLLYELKADLRLYLREAGFPNGMGSLADVIAFNRANAEREMPYFAQEIFEQADTLGDLTSQAYLDALATARRLSRDEGIDAVMDANGLDAIVAPTTRPAWKIDLVNRDVSSAGASGPAAIAGYPSITVPNGHVLGLPVGILFYGRPWREDVLLRLAYAYEQATLHRRPARLLPSLDLRNA